jgi:hypothetical protein
MKDWYRLGLEVWLGRRRLARNSLRALHVFDEHLLNKPIRLVNIRVVVALSDIAHLLQALVAENLAGFAKGLEGVLRLTRHDDIADESEEITFSGSIREVSRRSHSSSEHLLRLAGLSSQLRLVVLEHSLVPAHGLNVSGAQVAKAWVFSLLLVILERFEKGLVLHDCVVDLTLQKIDAAIHVQAPLWVNKIRGA